MRIRSSTRSPYAAWRIMIAIDVAIFPALFFYKLFFSEPSLQYMHLLVTYHFGFTKRALIGTLLSLFTDTVPVAAVYILGLAAWLVAAGLFLLAFGRTFGFDRRNLPLFAFLFGSPFFLKNFMYSIGYFDVCGCIVAFIALLIPARPLYPVAIGCACVLLIFIHHLHFLLYLPTICFIAFVRCYWLAGRSRLTFFIGAAFALIFAVAFIAAAFFGRIPVAPETLLAYMHQRATGYFDPDYLFVWNVPIADDMALTGAVFYRNAMRIPVYLALIALHLPVLRYLERMIAFLAVPDRRLVVLAIGGITVSYLFIFVVALDYSRWVCNWAVCMLLVMHAVRLIPSAGGPVDEPIAHDDKTNLVLGWIVTLIPRVGITKPF